MNEPTQSPIKKPPMQEEGLVEWFMDVFLPRFGRQSLYVVSGIAVVVLGTLYFNKARDTRQAHENKELGRAFVYYDRHQLDSAEAALSVFVKANRSALVMDKANLMLGQIFYEGKRYDDAIKAFGAVEVSTSHALISSGAMHGLAASYIQKKDFAKAAEILETFVSKFMRKTGAPSERVSGSEVVDLSPAVPNALWKLALCYRELKNPEKAKITAKKIVDVYPDTRESMDATRLIAQLP